MNIIYPPRLSSASRLFEHVIRLVRVLHFGAALWLVRLRYEKEIWQFIRVVARDESCAEAALRFWRHGALDGYKAGLCSIRAWCYRAAWTRLCGLRLVLDVGASYYRADAGDRAHRAWARLDETTRMLVYLSKVFGFSEKDIAIIGGRSLAQNDDLHVQIRAARARARAAYADEARTAAGARGRGLTSWAPSLAWSRRTRKSASDEQSPSY